MSRFVPLLVALLPVAAALDASYEPPADPPEAELVKPGGFVVALAVAADGTLVWGELEGDVYRWDAGADEWEAIHSVDATRGPEWGLTGLALSPSFDETGEFFVAATTAPPGTNVSSPDARGTMRIVRVHEGEESLVYSYVATRGHNSGRLLVHDDLLYVSNGDHKDKEAAQDPAREEGKILRMTLEGEPAPGNPAELDPAWHPYAYSMGHRNPFGLAWDTQRDTLVESEAGEHGDEEVNVIAPGANYGWPLCEGRCDSPRPDLVDAIVVYPRTVTPVGITVVGSDYYIGTFNTKEIRRVFETPEGWTDEVVYVHDQGLLEVEVSHDGEWIYFGSWNGLWRIPVPEASRSPSPPPTTEPPTTTDPLDLEGGGTIGAGTEDVPALAITATILVVLAVAAGLGRRVRGR